MLGIVIVNYRNYPLTEKYVTEELPKIRIPYKAVVVDNGATAQESAALEQKTGVKVIPHSNEGFAIGNNVGLMYLVNHFDIDYVLFSNTDIHFQSGNTVERMIEKMASDERIGILGPQIIGLDGQRQSPEPYIGMWDRYVFVYLATPFMSPEAKRKRFYLNYATEAQEGFHYKLMGSFFLCRAKDLLLIDGFDPNTFLYAEEMILSERMKTIGKRAYFYPEVTVVHEHGATINSRLSEKKRAVSQWESDSYYYRQYKGYSRLSCLVVGFFFRFHLFIQLLKIRSPKI